MDNKFSPSKIAERKFSTALRKVARIVGGIVHSHVDGSKLINEARMVEALKLYSDSLEPWAKRLAAEMFKQLSRTNKRAYESAGKNIGAALVSNMAENAIGSVSHALQNRQVELIKSLPIEAGIRAQGLAQQAAMGGRRADEVAEALARTEGVTLSRATLIARTEIAKANAALTQARAAYVGATQYIWQTAEDGDVRDSHAKMQGLVFDFDRPPTLEDGMTGNPGEFPNCRCFAEPIINTSE